MRAAGWIIFVAAAIVAVVMWQRGNYQVNDAAQQYQRQRQEMLDRQARNEERVKGQIASVEQSVKKRDDDLAAKRQEKTELETKVKKLEQDVATADEKVDLYEEYLPKLGTLWNEMN